MLPVTRHVRFHVPTPIRRIDAGRHVTMERGIRPVLHPLHMAVFQWIHMHIIHMPLVIGLVADQMLPIVPLPVQ